ncbi:toxin [Candidatus Roizmanbacteria bacterium CG_4_9_14_0_2_um_filter_39_13]|uniref:Toxin n=1 Tax=Candidatus Roizmanbacteria bacterium CG_4_9_14_0_2_um_filter_39_13 TaxID=1974839 RepID=A0A2M8EZQ4_9BACT|nr:MAG: toxin [Candidatus Roizmanbacteria bacterium CG_4_10_14_0_2_um_filter_39_12]PJC32521.1 MAG: toxin [Candidatus Roizmanbacteria bacterium CG_4_9_14_0_2_um_filter_39_13]
MKFDIEYNEEKNQILERTRNVSFEDVRDAIENDQLVTIINHPNKKKYKHQLLLIVKINQYIFAVPCVWDDARKVYFLKTVYPNRKLTTKYLT